MIELAKAGGNTNHWSDKQPEKAESPMWESLEPCSKASHSSRLQFLKQCLVIVVPDEGIQIDGRSAGSDEKATR
jgi:hypothetical protein